MTLIAYHNKRIWCDSLNLALSPDTNDPDYGMISYKNKIFTDPGYRIAVASGGSLFNNRDQVTLATALLALVTKLEDEESEHHKAGFIELPKDIVDIISKTTIVLSAKNAYKISFKTKTVLSIIDDDDVAIFYGSSDCHANMVFAYTKDMMKTFQTIFKFDPVTGGTVYSGGCENLNPIKMIKDTK